MNLNTALPPSSERRTAIKEFVRAICGELQDLRSSSQSDVVCRCFLVYYQRFLSANELLRQLCTTFRLDAKHKKSYDLGALRVLRKWLELRYSDFNRSLVRTCCDALTKFSETRRNPTCESIIVNEVNATKLALLRANKLWQQKRSAPVATRNLTATPTTPTKLSSPLLMSHPARLLAECLTAIEAEFFVSVPIAEFTDKGWTDARRAPHLWALIMRTNRVTQWVASNVLVQVNANVQTHLVNKFIDVAYFCQERGNFASAVAIMQAFNLGYVARLRHQWKLNKDARVLRQSLEPLLDPSDNYRIYREHIRARMKSGSLCIPYLGVYQKDLTFAEDANPDYMPNGSINVNKMLVIGTILRDIESLQQQCTASSSSSSSSSGPTTISAEGEHINTLRSQILDGLRLLPCRSEIQLEMLSERLRPRIASVDEGSTTMVSTTSSSDTSSTTDRVTANDTKSSSSDYSELVDV